jgi:hypothetical protein
MDPTALIRIERLNYILGGVLVASAALLMTTQQALGVLVGVVLAAANFTFIRMLVVKALDKSKANQDSNTAMLFVPKMMALMGFVAAAIYFLPIAPVGLAIGFSVFLVSIGVETLRYLTSPNDES